MNQRILLLEDNAEEYRKKRIKIHHSLFNVSTIICFEIGYVIRYKTNSASTLGGLTIL